MRSELVDKSVEYKTTSKDEKLKTAMFNTSQSTKEGLCHKRDYYIYVPTPLRLCHQHQQPLAQQSQSKQPNRHARTKPHRSTDTTGWLPKQTWETPCRISLTPLPHVCILPSFNRPQPPALPPPTCYVRGSRLSLTISS